jgi:DNA helicase-2/ATP-dependent DNA helicase PcrA
VIVAGLEEELFPHRGFSPDDDAGDLEEERRLAYVAFTRAEQRLFLSYASARRVYGELKMRMPSRFLREMPASELDMLAGQADSRSGRAPQRNSSRPLAQSSTYAARGVAHGGHSARSNGESYVDLSEGSDLPHAGLRKGMRVRHAKFGIGEVHAVSPEEPPRVTVRFPGWGEKTLLSSYLEPA